MFANNQIRMKINNVKELFDKINKIYIKIIFEIFYVFISFCENFY